MEKKTENNRSADKFLVVMKHMTHGKVMFSTDWAVSIHVTEQLLRTSHSVGRSSSVVLSHLVSPEEPLVGLTLEGLRHQCSEPRTVFARRPQQLEKSKNNSTTSAGIVHIYCRYCKSSGHNYMFISHFKTVCVCVCVGWGGVQLARFTAEVNTDSRHRERLELTCASFCSAVLHEENIYVARQPTLSWALGMVCTGIGRHGNWGMMGAGRLVGGNIPARQAWALMRVRS